MTIVKRRAADRGALSLDWIESRFTFSFGDYYDPRHLGYGALRALNEHRLAAGRGFDPQWRSDLEILSYVCHGALRHRDSLGNDVLLQSGGLQRLSAGRGAEASLANASSSDPARFLQIWILPEENGGAPNYATSTIAPTQTTGALRLIASRNGRDGSLSVKRDVDLYVSTLPQGGAVVHPLGRDREAWIQLLQGEIAVNGEVLTVGDGIGLVNVEILKIDATEDAELLLFDMSRD